MQKLHWQYYFARKFSLQRFQIVMRVFVSDFYWTNFKVRLRHMMVKPEEGGNQSIWLDRKEFDRMLSRIFAVACKNLQQYLFYKRMIKRVQKQWARAAKQAGERVRASISNKKLGVLYDSFIRWQQEHFNGPIWIPFPLEPVLSKAAEDALTSVLTRERRMDEYSHWFSVIFAPEEKNAITAAEEAMLRVAIAIKQKKIRGRGIRAAFARLARSHGFIPCYDVIDAPWDEAHFAKEVRALVKKDLRALQHDLRDIRTRFAKRRRAFRDFLREFTLRVREKELFIMAHDLVFIKDERDDYRRLGSYYGRPIFAEIGRRARLITKETAYLTIEETQNFLRHGTELPSVAEVRERVAGYVLLQKPRMPMIVASGRQAREVIRQELGDTHRTHESEVKGLVGSPGKARGIAVIVRTKHDLRRIRQGAIMIALTTNPDFVPAMKKCKAIVTNEGGVTAHAAIVSRELNIPCVVGTKIATEVFKMGDRVEVNANHGIVRKL